MFEGLDSISSISDSAVPYVSYMVVPFALVLGVAFLFALVRVLVRFYSSGSAGGEIGAGVPNGRPSVGTGRPSMRSRVGLGKPTGGKDYVGKHRAAGSVRIRPSGGFGYKGKHRAS